MCTYRVSESHGGDHEEGNEYVDEVVPVDEAQGLDGEHADHDEGGGGGCVGDDGDEGEEEREGEEEARAGDDGGDAGLGARGDAGVGLDVAGDAVGADHRARPETEAVHHHGSVDASHCNLWVSLHEAGALHDTREGSEGVEQLDEEEGEDGLPEDARVGVLEGELSRGDIGSVDEPMNLIAIARFVPVAEVGHTVRIMGAIVNSEGEGLAVGVVDADEGA